MSGMGCYVLIEIALRDRVPQERPVTIPEIYATEPDHVRQAFADGPVQRAAQVRGPGGQHGGDLVQVPAGGGREMP
jgi:hypothetical protein